MRASAKHSGRRIAYAGAAAALGLSFLPLAGQAAFADGGAPGGAVFVQLNAASGNEIAAYSRAADGTLTQSGIFPTGGLGGTQLGAPLDALASQHGLVLDQSGRTLLAVNAGSDTVTSFGVQGANLTRTSVVASGGDFPTSVTVHGNLVYVLDAGGDGAISGFRLENHTLVPLAGSTRTLGLGNAATPFFIQSPAQVGFSADGRDLIVTTKLHNELLTFPIDSAGRPASTPVVTASAGPVPFSFVVDREGFVHVTEAGTGRTSTYTVQGDGSLGLVNSSAGDGQAALCWNVQVGDHLYGANAGSATLSSWTIGADGSTALDQAVAAGTGAGPIDLAASRDLQFLYVQESVSGTLGAYSVADDGSLSRIQTVTGLPAFSGGGMEGIAAS